MWKAERLGGPEKGRSMTVWGRKGNFFLTAESVQGSALPLQSVDDVHSRNGLSLSVLSVCYGVSDDVLEKHFQHTSSFLVNKTGDTFYSSTPRQPSDSGLGYSLDIVTEDFPVPLSASLSKTLTSFTTASHDASAA